MFETAAQRRGIALKTFVWASRAGARGQDEVGGQIQDGIEQDKAKSIVKLIKETKMKVQASIQGRSSA